MTILSSISHEIETIEATKYFQIALGKKKVLREQAS